MQGNHAEIVKEIKPEIVNEKQKINIWTSTIKTSAGTSHTKHTAMYD